MSAAREAAPSRAGARGAAALAALAAGAAAPAALRIGFLSDDWSQLETARRIGWSDPLVPHHAAPLLTALYKSVHAGWLGAASWHALALALHALNVALVWRVLHRHLDVGPRLALAAAGLVALAPGGLEAVLWTAASPFVALLAVLLLAVDCALGALRDERPLRRGESLWLALLQLAGFAIWDWAIVLVPLLAALAVAHAGRAGLRRAAPGLLPTAAVWAACLALRSGQGAALGYGLFPLGALRGTLLLAAQPAMQLFPALPKLMIALLAVPCLLGLALAALRSRSARVLLAAFAVLQLPVYLEGAPSSRYAYLSLAFLLPALAVGLCALLPARASACALAAVALLEGYGYLQVSRDWLDAARQAGDVRRELALRLAGVDPAVPVVVVNLPDHLAPARGLWPPPLWRNGLAALRPGARKVFTPQHAARFEPDAPRIAERAAIAGLFPGAALLEVVPQMGGGSAYAVVPFDAAAARE